MNGTFTPIPGLRYIPNYLNETDHDRLISAIDRQIWMADLKRRVQHYGYRYDYKRRTVDPSMFLGALPAWVMPLAERLHDDGLMPEIPDQLIINEYISGQGIASHVDCEPCFGNVIVSITLGSGCLINFNNLATKARVSLFLEPRSLFVMQDEARYQWKHGILPRKADEYEGKTIQRNRRVSLTFRSVVFDTKPIEKVVN
jgi:alkylated DNA repair dioxygenase AlkB